MESTWNTSPLRSASCELKSEQDAYMPLKVICYFKFLITNVLHTHGGKHTSFCKQLKETPQKALDCAEKC